MEELGGKINADDKATTDAALEKVKETLKGTDTEAIKNATEELTKAFYAISEKLYQSQGGGAQPDMDGADMGGQANVDPNVVDADYEVVDDNNENN